MVRFCRRLKEHLKLELHYILEVYYFWGLIRKYNASSRTDRDIEKMQYTLSRETHTIEKGMSMRNPRKGFGQVKVFNLIRRLKKYCGLFLAQDSAFLDYPLNTIQSYINYTHSLGVDIPQIDSAFKDLLKVANREFVNGKAGIMFETKEHIMEECNKNFESLLYSRHSMRYFSIEPVSRNLLNKALELAQRTPSACNRQGWQTHIYQASKSIDLIKWQGGSRGFEEEIRCAILVTANMKAFLSHEVHQAYIDGGLYAMNLINALHSLGLGTIPLSCGFNYSHLRKLQEFGVAKHEVPILIIGIGHLPDKYYVAVSERKPIEIGRAHV